MLKDILKYRKDEFLKTVSDNIPDTHRELKEAMRILEEYINFIPAEKNQDISGLIRGITLNCGYKGNHDPQIQIYVVIGKDQEGTGQEHGEGDWLLVEEKSQEVSTYDNALMAAILLLKGYDPAFDLTKKQIDEANQIKMETLVEELGNVNPL